MESINFFHQSPSPAESFKPRKFEQNKKMNFHQLLDAYSQPLLLIFHAVKSRYLVAFAASQYKRKEALLYRIGLPSNIPTPLALFVRIELQCFSSFIHQQTCVATNTAIAVQIMTR